ncbi:MAG TPA: hypothetical protein VG099_14940 [Gemmataceae bacterium]|jgi:hypothetical protein|nr:hypothetical protein [Gemmataceae bacterium]
MPSITEGQLTFTFPNDWQASKFDQWSFNRNQFEQVCGGAKAVDVLAVEPKVCLWQIEVKDYRQHVRTKTVELAVEIAIKVRDSLAALVAARANANDEDEGQMAVAALRCQRLGVVLHLEQPAKHSKLFPRAIDPANVPQRLKQLIKAIDPHPHPFTVASRPEHVVGRLVTVVPAYPFSGQATAMPGNDYHQQDRSTLTPRTLYGKVLTRAACTLGIIHLQESLP